MNELTHPEAPRNVHTIERLPVEYKQQFEIDGHSAFPTVEGLAGALRDDIVESGATDRNVGLAYKVSREIGDMIIARSDETHAVFQFLDETRDDAQPQRVEYDAGFTRGALHDAKNRLLKLGPRGFDSSAVEASLESKGMKLRHPDDAKVTQLIRIASHESGHAILAGVTRMLDRNGNGDAAHHFAASGAFLKSKPELAFTGDWNVDVSVREEQFAEGYSAIVVDKVLDGLGYEGEDKDHFRTALMSVSMFEGEFGENQIDYLNGAVGGVALNQLVTSNIDQPENYPGKLGYGKPLTLEEILEQLRELNMICHNDEGLGLGYSDDQVATWPEQVEAVAQAEDVSLYLDRLQAERVAALSVERDPVNRRALLGAVSAGLLRKLGKT